MVSLPGKSFRPETRIRKESRKITDQAARIRLSEKKVEREGIGVRMTINKGDGAPGETRTPDPLLRRQTLYPPELRARRLILKDFAPSRPSICNLSYHME